MRKAKISNYQLTGSIHTLSITTTDPVIQGVPESVLTYAKWADGKYHCKINPNKLQGDCMTYSEFTEAMQIITDSCGINNYQIVRVDFRMDSTAETFYTEYAKMNRLLIVCCTNQWKSKNAYETYDLIRRRLLSCCCKTSTTEIEYYDKAAESNGTDQAAARLEIRSKGVFSNVPMEFIDAWTKRLEWACGASQGALQAINDSLTTIYQTEMDKINNDPKAETPWRSMIDFILQYRAVIFSKRQLIDLLAAIGAENPKSTATYVKDRHHLEFISNADMQAATNEIKRCIGVFFCQ